jgi:hypothetical protein
MSFLSRAARSGIPSALPDSRAGCYDADQAGRYLTDGANLYRHVGAISSGMGQMVGLEDCRTLDVMLLPIGELHARRLRPVMPSRTG